MERPQDRTVTADSPDVVGVAAPNTMRGAHSCAAALGVPGAAIPLNDIRPSSPTAQTWLASLPQILRNTHVVSPLCIIPGAAIPLQIVPYSPTAQTWAASCPRPQIAASLCRYAGLSRRSHSISGSCHPRRPPRCCWHRCPRYRRAAASYRGLGGPGAAIPLQDRAIIADSPDIVGVAAPDRHGDSPSCR